MQNNWCKRILSSILALTLVLGYVPVTALAEEPGEQTLLVETEAAEETLPEATEELLLLEETEATQEPGDVLLLEEEANGETEPEYDVEEYVLTMEIPDDFVAPFASVDASEIPSEGIPSSYDSRENNVITSVKKQSPYGFCWAFSAIAVSESSLLSFGKADSSVDLSEWHLAQSIDGDAYDPLGNASGDSTVRSTEGNNNVFTTFALANWVGAASEDAYPYYPNNTRSPAKGTADVMDDAYHLTNAYWINAQDTENIKYYIMRNGAVGLSYYSDVNKGGYNFNRETNAYYNKDVTDTNHAVTVVGWDDNFSASNFNTDPGADGAWLVKNSWGENWGDGGYFWLSYKDASINTADRKAFVFEMEPADNYDFNYHYDGSFGNRYYTVPSGSSMASVFTASGCKSGQAEEIRAVGMGIASANVNYSIQIYRNPIDPSDPTSGAPMLSAPQTGTTHTAGFYTAKLDTPVTVSQGDRFAVVITLRAQDGSEVRFFADATYENISNGKAWITFTSHTEPRQSFLGNTSGYWQDLNGQSAAARVKAYTKVVDAVPLTGLSFPKSTVELRQEEVFFQEPVPVPAAAHVGACAWSSSDSDVATVDTDGTVTAGKPGSATIMAKVTVGGRSISASYQVAVLGDTTGKCGENLLWQVEDGTLRIYAAETGTPGAMNDYSLSNPAPWATLSDQITYINMEAGTTIGANAFVGLSEVAYATLSPELTDIVPGAFVGCGKLVDFDFVCGETEQGFFGNGPVLLKRTASMGIQVVTVAPSVSGQFDVPNYGVLLPGALLGCEEIRSIHFRDAFWYLPDGALAGCAENLTLSFEGAVPPYIEKQAFAGHVVTIADCPVNWSWSEVAKDGDYGGTAIWPAELLDMTAEMSLRWNGVTLDDRLELDMQQADSLNLTVIFQPADAAQSVTWRSGNTTVASVNQNGTVTLKKPGTAVITATASDGSGAKASVTLDVYYVTRATKLTAQLPDIGKGLQPGQTAALTVKDSNGVTVAPSALDFTISNSKIATVDENGTVTAGTTPGTATVTASLRGDPLNRKATARVTVIALQAEALTLTVDGKEQTELALSVDADSRGFQLAASAVDYDGNAFTPKVIWASSDTSVAKVDSAGVLTIPANASGQCVVTATANDQNKATAQLTVSVRDYSPRLGTNKITLNSYAEQGVALDLRESYGNAIESVELVNAPDGLWLKDRTLYGKDVKNGTYNLGLNVTCTKGSYPYNLQVKVANSLPAVTVKQTEKLNLFYLDSTASLTITAPGQTITGVSLEDTDDFTVKTGDNGYVLSPKGALPAKPDTKATLKITLAGYNTPVSKAITISTVTTAPKLALSPVSSTINTAYGNQSVSMGVMDKDGKNLNLDTENTTVTASFADASFKDGKLTLALEGTAGGTAYVDVQLDNWARGVRLSHKITVTNKLPSIKLGSSTLRMDRVFTAFKPDTPVYLTQSNAVLDSVTVEPTAKVGTSTRDQADKIRVVYEDGCLRAEFVDPEDLPKAGTYSYAYKGTLEDGTAVSGGTLKVAVGGSLPKVKLSAATVKLNQQMKGDEAVEVTPTVSGYLLSGFEDTYSWMTYEDGRLRIRLTDELGLGTHKFTLHAMVVHPSGGQPVSVEVPLTVQVYSATPGVSLSAKGTLDTMKPDSAIVYTPRLKNCAGTITGVELTGQDKDKFSAELVDGTISLTMQEGVKYATNVTYKVQFALRIGEKTIPSPVTSVKVTQSRAKLTVTPATLTLYQSQRSPLTAAVTASLGEIQSVSVNSKTSADLKAALKLDAFGWDDSTGVLTLPLGDTGLLKAGKSYTLYLDVTPVGNATNLSPSQVRLTVKVLK